MVITNALANILPINGINTGQVSNSYPNLFAPAAVTFSIWGLIYLLLAAYTIYQFGFFQKEREKKKDEVVHKVGVCFIITSVANIFWIFSWHYNFIGVSLIWMIVILFFLIKIASLLKKEELSRTENIFIKLPFSIYFGWITVATIANITVFLVSLGWDRFGMSEQLWTILLLLIGAAVGIFQMIKNKNIPYGLVFVWAYAGILTKHLSQNGFAGHYTGIITTVAICIFIFLIVIPFSNKSLKKQTASNPGATG
jgi:hypothetical protein